MCGPLPRVTGSAPELNSGGPWQPGRRRTRAAVLFLTSEAIVDTRRVQEAGRLEIAAAGQALAWVGGDPYDIAEGWRRFALDGSKPESRFNGYGSNFDAVVVSPGRDVAALVQSTGTKALMPGGVGLNPGGWRLWSGYARLRSPGCYGLQVDGITFSEVSIFRACLSSNPVQQTGRCRGACRAGRITCFDQWSG